jgi:hypothetical protein
MVAAEEIPPPWARAMKQQLDDFQEIPPPWARAMKQQLDDFQEIPPPWARAMKQQLDDFQEIPPPWARAFQGAMVSKLQHLSTGVADLQEDVANLKTDMADVKKAIRSAYCRPDPGLLSGLVHDPEACVALLGCSNLADSSLMSKSEIVADFVVNDRGAGLVADAGGDCQFAAGMALKFFERRRLMQARVETGVLHSPSAARVVMGVASGAFASGGLPDERGEVPIGARAYKLTAGCLWIRDPAADACDAVGAALKPRVGCTHSTVSVDTLEGERVVVDWGIKQFSEIPSDMRLFI